MCDALRLGSHRREVTWKFEPPLLRSLEKGKNAGENILIFVTTFFSGNAPAKGKSDEFHQIRAKGEDARYRGGKTLLEKYRGSHSSSISSLIASLLINARFSLPFSRAYTFRQVTTLDFAFSISVNHAK